MDVDKKIKDVIDSLVRDYSKIRSSRVSVSILDNLRVDSYGQMVPLNQVASVSNPESRLIVISPWDKSALSEIEKAIQKENLGVNPSNDGKVIRLAFPPLSEERRKESVKSAKDIAEKHKVSVRNIRRDEIDSLKKAEKNSEISEDDRKQQESALEEKVEKAINEISTIFDKKSAEIMTI